VRVPLPRLGPTSPYGARPRDGGPVPRGRDRRRGLDNGAPGPRPQYHANYYGAFVLDPDGHDIEAVCHQRER
jgi:hypothetical protein